MSMVVDRKVERTFSLRQTESAFSGILILGVHAGPASERRMPRVKIRIEITIELTTQALSALVLVIAKAILSALK